NVVGGVASLKPVEVEGQAAGSLFLKSIKPAIPHMVANVIVYPSLSKDGNYFFRFAAKFEYAKLCFA
ncbi:MAG: hypothetical protein JWO06_3931, partial [Bacteroidota bacterium]|nr:hypothetical protein [Bacteroidota bacterium]